jgi:hypothetical protein
VFYNDGPLVTTSINIIAKEGDSSLRSIVCQSALVGVSMCMSVSICVYVCQYDRVRGCEIEPMCVCVCMCVRLCVCAHKRGSVCERMCAYVTQSTSRCGSTCIFTVCVSV